MTLSLASVLGLTTRFLVSVDGVDLGGWGRCEHLSVDFKPFSIYEGGNYDYKPVLPGQMEYPNITLERAMNGADSAKVQQWLASRAQSWVHGLGSGHDLLGQVTNVVSSAVGAGSSAGGTAKITLCDATGGAIITWTLRNVYPARWTGPTLNAQTGGIAMESLELAHEGFL